MVLVRAGKAEDVAEVHRLVIELALYEREPASSVVLTAEQMARDFAGGAFELFVSERPEGNGLAGFAMWYRRYSTWTGRCVYLEDLFVEEAHRGRGVGTALFEAVMRKAAELNAARMEWVCLAWNEPAVKFYRERFSAQVDAEWLQCRVVRQQLQNTFAKQ